MHIDVIQDYPDQLADYARISIAFEVSRVLVVVPAVDRPGEFDISERALPAPWVKDYDAIPDEGPEGWPARFDTSRWALFGAYADGARVGGAAVAVPSPGMSDAEGQRDLAVLHDIRVAPSFRGRGVGRALLAAAESWVVECGGRSLEVETQDINVPACRFYQRHGFRLREVHGNAYPEFPDETQLLWYKELG